MYILYNLLLTLAFIVLLPYFLLRQLTGGKSSGNLKEKFGFLALGSKNEPGEDTIWLHAVSVGEAIAVAPLVAALRERYPKSRLVVSTTTATGQDVARKKITNADAWIYFPFDLPFSVARALDRVAPKLVVLVESELWPNFLNAARKRGVAVMVANGRISDRTFARLTKLKKIAQFLYRNVSLFAMQTEEDKRRAIALGAPAGSVIAAGNLKYDVSVPPPSQAAWSGLNGTPLIIAGSTGEGEDEIVLGAFKHLIEMNPDFASIRLLIAPRHPERFSAVATLAASRGLKVQRRSSGEPAGAAQVLLLDTVGELASLYSTATVVFVGGSLLPYGGHNVLEPASFARPIIVGPFMDNFRAITEDFLAQGALVQIASRLKDDQVNELAGAFRSILLEEQKARDLGQNALRTFEANRGATLRHLDAIEKLLDPALNS